MSDGSAVVDPAAVADAELALEVARRLFAPMDPLPKGDRPPLALALYRYAAARLAIAFGEPARATLAAHSALGPRASELAETLLFGACDREATNAGVASTSTSPSRAELDLCRRFLEGLIATACGPELIARNRRRRRLSRVVAAAASAAAVLFAGQWALDRWRAGPDLAGTASWRTSSTMSTCEPKSGCGGAFFHTLEEENPWIEYDFGKAIPIREVEVANRPDCCGERALPLVVETRNDDSAWAEVARRESPFHRWRARMATTSARYLRLRVPRKTALHLEKIEIR